MRLYVALVLDTERPPKAVTDEVVSNLNFDNQEVLVVVVLDEHGKELARYEGEEPT